MRGLRDLQRMIEDPLEVRPVSDQQALGLWAVAPVEQRCRRPAPDPLDGHVQPHVEIHEREGQPDRRQRAPERRPLDQVAAKFAAEQHAPGVVDQALMKKHERKASRPRQLEAVYPDQQRERAPHPLRRQRPHGQGVGEAREEDPWMSRCEGGQLGVAYGAARAARKHDLPVGADNAPGLESRHELFCDGRLPGSR